jgi:hypothetical protein
MWETQRLTTLWTSKACYKDSFTFTLPYRSSKTPIANKAYFELYECFETDGAPK